MRITVVSSLFIAAIAAPGCGSDEKETPSPVDTTAVVADTNFPIIDTSSFAEIDTTDEGPEVIPDEFKIGHLYSAEILLVMPARAAVDKELEQMAKNLETEIGNMFADYQQKYGQLLTDTTMSQARQEALTQELMSLEQNIQSLQSGAQNTLLQEKETRYQPIYNQVNAAIKRVAQREEFTYIVDASTGALVYGLDSYDITPLVKRELGLR